jgi:hypothetical protein
MGKYGIISSVVSGAMSMLTCACSLASCFSVALCLRVIKEKSFLVDIKNYADVLWKASCEPGFRGKEF